MTGMKVLISNAVWGEAYCSVFTRYSLATLLSRGNIPELAKHAALTYHIVTTRRDRRRLLRDSTIAELARYCAIEWEVIEDFGIYQPPTGPGGEKYPFLSALQNIAIARSLDHDAIVFNYADFIWADGSLSVAVKMLSDGDKAYDAVLAFCLPVDRDSAIPALGRYRKSGSSGAIELAPRDGARIAIEHMHREAKIRFWDAPRFTNLPSYLMWPVDAQGVVLRAYHQSILAMRVRRDDPQFCRGIARGGLDSAFTGQLAKTGLLTFASDTDKVLVFSLYHTPVDSRLPAGVTREMSLRSLLRADVIPEQRRFAEFPFFLKLRDGDEAAWKRVAENSWQFLQRVQERTRFDQSTYDERYETHGLIPKISRQNFLKRYVFSRLYPLIYRTRNSSLLKNSSTVAGRAVSRIRRIAFVLRDPPLLRATIKRRLVQSRAWRRSKRIWLVLWDLPLLHAAIERRRRRAERIWFILRNPPLLRAAIKQRLPWSRRVGFAIAPNIYVDPDASARLTAAISIENTARNIVDYAAFVSELGTAEKFLRWAMTASPVWIDPVRALGRNLWFQGRFDEAMRTFAAAEKLRDTMASMADLPINSCLFLPRDCAQSIGLMGHLDAFAKYRTLNADPRPYYLLAPPQDVVNSAFLDYWKEHLSIVSEPEQITKLLELERIYGVNWNWVMPDDGRIVFVHEGMAAVQRAWQQAGRGPLLRLSEDHADALSRTRAKWGMKEEERFVCLHVRSVGFYGESNEQAQKFRNTTFESYYALIQTLTDMGLWVIRMGDPSMPPLDVARCGSAGRVVDYALSPEKSAELDVALCAQCELFVSSPSGLHTVAHAFGRPVCDVNYPIYSGFPWHPDDIFIPQLYYSRDKGRTLTLSEVLGSDLVHRDHQFLLERAGISLLPNDPDDIIETVLEALSPSTYRVPDANLADRVRATFDELNRRHNLSISGRLGRYFAMKYAPQLLGAQDHLRMSA
jgi:putative glycosyltransferase (TIGR04372 family)